MVKRISCLERKIREQEEELAEFKSMKANLEKHIDELQSTCLRLQRTEKDGLDRIVDALTQMS